MGKRAYNPRVINPNDTFGKWTVVSELPERNKHNKRMFQCRCDCGNEAPVQISNLLRGSSTACGMCQMYKIGDTVRSWIIRGFARDNGGRQQFKCDCRCGRTLGVWILGNSMKMKQSGSCVLCRNAMLREIADLRDIETRLAAGHAVDTKMSPLNTQDRHLEKKTAAAVKKRDGFKCVLCGVAAKFVHSHHVHLFSKHKDLRGDPRYMVTLCNGAKPRVLGGCHLLAHDGSPHRIDPAIQQTLLNYLTTLYPETT